ncbi:ATP-binding protein [Streptomyces sp. NPDC046862]|uniref:ATP-binding protein n=1 Tax=Streptomyces sp. NPDC046862 TaxID=3154603 RepID=UPI0034535F8F
MTTALRESLKTLRLSGMLETLDAHLTQAQKGELGQLHFLQVLCRDEITRRETVVFERRLRQAKFEQQATLEGFDFTASPKLPAAQIRDLAALRWLHSGESVSPRPAASWPSSPAATRTEPGTNASTTRSAPTCSSSMTSRCAR